MYFFSKTFLMNPFSKEVLRYKGNIAMKQHLYAS